MTSISYIPLDALVQVLCKLNHDEVKSLITVSKAFLQAALVAREVHFAFQTPEATSFRPLAVKEVSPEMPAMRVLYQKKIWRFRPSSDQRKLAVSLFPI
ncbi:hypothetical protein ZOSMA_4G01090 [Zostera marina]|uniref:F-box domain-containing protein n=1 Tax=Zostera marina TaxID=29655 RepID=A0A0K9P0T1_ZOSMR|nr:hypothetical protein ZOSMA_4G01090 [Zostera marina]